MTLICNSFVSLDYLLRYVFLDFVLTSYDILVPKESSRNVYINSLINADPELEVVAIYGVVGLPRF